MDIFNVWLYITLSPIKPSHGRANTRLSYFIRLLSVRLYGNTVRSRPYNPSGPIKSIRCNSFDKRFNQKSIQWLDPYFLQKRNSGPETRTMRKSLLHRNGKLPKGFETGRNRHFKAGWLPNSAVQDVCWTAICSPMMPLTAVIPAYESAFPGDCGEDYVH